MRVTYRERAPIFTPNLHPRVPVEAVRFCARFFPRRDAFPFAGVEPSMLRFSASIRLMTLRRPEDGELVEADLAGLPERIADNGVAFAGHLIGRR
jgi:hypothetical protein